MQLIARLATADRLGRNRLGGAVRTLASPSAGGSDNQLVAAYRCGEERAFTELVARYQARLRGMCWRYLRDERLAEDIVQETFLRLLENVSRIDESFNVSAWIHRIATNLCVDELRHRARHDRAPRDDEGDGGAPVADMIDGDRACIPEDAIDAEITRDLIRQAAQRLPLRQREILLLRDVRGLSQADAAGVLGLSGGAVRGILFRARERFREEYVSVLGVQPGPPGCATTAYMMENLPLAGLRQDRLGAVRRHLFGCASCRSRFDGSMMRATTPATPTSRDARAHPAVRTNATRGTRPSAA